MSDGGTTLDVVIDDGEKARLASLAADTADEEAITLATSDPTIDRIRLRLGETGATFAKVERNGGGTTHIRDVVPADEPRDVLEERIQERIADLKEKNDGASPGPRRDCRRKRIAELERLV